MGQALATGDVLRGKYRLEHVLGRGGMGIVHLATHVVIGQRVAIKIVNFPGARGRPDDGAQQHVTARFLREARAASLLQSEHVVRILDVDSTEDGDPFMVMELLQGTDLGGLLKKGGRLPVGEAVGYVLQACEALAEAHAAGIVHRDLKPSNLFRTTTPRGEARIKLLDFGISKLAEPGDDLSLTETNAVVGSPLFMSPEQLLSSRDVDHRTDIWSLGVTLYQLLSGALPFEASTATGLGAQIAATDPRPLSETAPDMPAELSSAVMCCLARSKQNRFEDIVSLARACAPFAAGDGAALVAAVERAAERGRRGQGPLPAPPSMPSTPPPEASGERWTQSRAAANPRMTQSAVGALAPAPRDVIGPPTPPPPPAPPRPRPAAGAPAPAPTAPPAPTTARLPITGTGPRRPSDPPLSAQPSMSSTGPAMPITGPSMPPPPMALPATVLLPAAPAAPAVMGTMAAMGAPVLQAPGDLAPRKTTRWRIALGVVVVLAMLVGAVFVGRRSRTPDVPATDPSAEAALGSPSTSPPPSGKPEASESGEAPSASSATRPAPPPRWTPPSPRGRPRPPPPTTTVTGKGTSWSKDPSELELK